MPLENEILSRSPSESALESPSRLIFIKRFLLLLLFCSFFIVEIFSGWIIRTATDRVKGHICIFSTIKLWGRLSNNSRYEGIHILHFLFILENICCGYSFEAPRLAEAFLISTQNTCFHGETKKANISTFRLTVYLILNYKQTKPSETLRQHAYSNILKILQPKKKNFQIKHLIFFFSYFCSMYRLWVLVRTASARRF